ncbi:hypothetical protein J6590_009658 [Homalodisca vitripennis]|nr:hypothetical protein J6590_009658 [Homalodisca vitripennis]
MREPHKASAPLFLDRSLSIDARKDELVILTCFAQGYPPPEYRRKKDRGLTNAWIDRYTGYPNGDRTARDDPYQGGGRTPTALYRHVCRAVGSVTGQLEMTTSKEAARSTESGRF